MKILTDINFRTMKKTISLILLYSFIFTNVFAVQVFAQDNVQTTADASALIKYTTDLTRLARNNEIARQCFF